MSKGKTIRHSILPKILLGLSAAWLMGFGYLFFVYSETSRDIVKINENIREIENLPFFERSIRNLLLEYEGIEKQSYSTKSISEFVAKIPQIGERNGIGEMKIENVGIRNDNNMEVTELKVTVSSMFRSVARFINELEMYGIPLQINNLTMKIEGGRLSTVFIVRIYKKMLGE